MMKGWVHEIEHRCLFGTTTDWPSGIYMTLQARNHIGVLKDLFGVVIVMPYMYMI